MRHRPILRSADSIPAVPYYILPEDDISSLLEAVWGKEVSEFNETFILDCYKGRKLDSTVIKTAITRNRKNPVSTI